MIASSTKELKLHANTITFTLKELEEYRAKIQKDTVELILSIQKGS